LTCKTSCVAGDVPSRKPCYNRRPSCKSGTEKNQTKQKNRTVEMRPMRQLLAQSQHKLTDRAKLKFQGTRSGSSCISVSIIDLDTMEGVGGFTVGAARDLPSFWPLGSLAVVCFFAASATRHTATRVFSSFSSSPSPSSAPFSTARPTGIHGISTKTKTTRSIQRLDFPCFYTSCAWDQEPNASETTLLLSTRVLSRITMRYRWLADFS
jgi:hypothetical protein